MNLPTARHYANKIVEWLNPFCHRIVVAGSIRRERPVCNDVDIVCVPQCTEEKDMFGEIMGRTNHALKHLQEHVASNPKARFISGGETEGKQVIVELSKCQLDLWFATSQTLATRLLCRTGSKEHNVWLAGRAKSREDHWNPYEGLFTGGHYEKQGDRDVYVGGSLVTTEIEEDIYCALDVPYIEPRDREIHILERMKLV